LRQRSGIRKILRNDGGRDVIRKVAGERGGSPLGPVEIEGVALHKVEALLIGPSLAQVFSEIGVHFEGDYAVRAGEEEFCQGSLAGADFDNLRSTVGTCRSRDAIKDSAALKEMLA
jgi:hypothetical protein